MIFVLMMALSGCSDTPPPKTANQDKSPQTAPTNEQEHKNSQQERDACQFLFKGEDLIHLMYVHEDAYNKHFRQREFPVRYFIDSNIPEILRYPIYEVVSEFNTEIGFNAFTIEGIYYDQIGTSTDENENDKKNLIYWEPSEGIIGKFLGLMMPFQTFDFFNQSFSFFEETDILINADTFLFLTLDPADIIRRNFLSMANSFGIEIPTDLLENFEVFQETGRIITDFVRNASIELIRELDIQNLEAQINLEDDENIIEQLQG